jgi:hypothetical protein
MPFVAAEVFAAMLMAYGMFRGRRDMWFGLVWAPVTIVAAFWIVIPVGIGAQYVMRWAGSDPSNPIDAG